MDFFAHTFQSSVMIGSETSYHCDVIPTGAKYVTAFFSTFYHTFPVHLQSACHSSRNVQMLKMSPRYKQSNLVSEEYKVEAI